MISKTSWKRQQTNIIGQKIIIGILFGLLFFAGIVCCFFPAFIEQAEASNKTPTMKGIDVSEWQSDINWAKVKNDGIDYAILRCGYSTSADAKWKTNANKCTSLSIPFGCYLYSYATSTDAAVKEAKFVLQQVKGYNLTFPIYYDLEDSTIQKLGSAKIGSIAKAFCDTITDAGYEVGIYANLYWWNDLLTDSKVQNSDWNRWVAQYYSVCEYTLKYSMWQYSSSGSVNGIDGDCDMNYWYDRPRTVITDDMEPTAVSNVDTLAFNQKIHVYWDDVIYNTGYQVYAMYEDGSKYKSADVTTNYCNFVNLENGSAYKFKVRSFITYSNGKTAYSDYSDQVSAIPYDDCVYNLKAVSYDARIKISWDAAEGSDGYYIYAMYGDNSKYKTYSTTKTSCNFTNLINGDTYKFKVRAYKLDNNGNKVYSTYSDVVSGQPKPAKITGLNSLSFYKKIHIYWNASESAEGYYIYAMYNDGSKYKTYSTVKNRCNFTNLANGSTYQFKVRGYNINSAGKKVYGSYSSVVSAVPCDDRINNLQAVSGDSKIKLSWDAAEGSDGYYIYAMYGDNSKYKTYSTTKTSCIFTNLINGDTYKFKVRAYKLDNNGNKVYSTYSAVVSAVPN